MHQESAESVESRPAVRALEVLLEQMLRVQLPDGRVLVGQLQCCDKQGNLVLHNTREYLAGSGAERVLGLVLVPREHRVAVEAQQEAAQLAESMASAVAS